MQSLRHIIASAGLRPFNEPRSHLNRAAFAQALCTQSGSSYHSPGAMRYFNCKIHAIKVVADGMAYVALESVQHNTDDRLYRPVVIDCTGRVADTVDLDDCTHDSVQADRWYREKLARFNDESYCRAFVQSMIEEKINSVENQMQDLRRGLRLIAGEELECTLIANDGNGNARYVVHFLNLLTREESAAPIDFKGASKYEIALNRARAINGRKFHNKQYGGGIVFTALTPAEVAENVSRVTGRMFVGVAA